jgi:hypothetical protein
VLLPEGVDVSLLLLKTAMILQIAVMPIAIKIA